MSTNAGFCDDRDGGEWDDEPKTNSESDENESTLACLVSVYQCFNIANFRLGESIDADTLDSPPPP